MLAREIGQYKESADTYAGLSEYVTPAETDGENGNAEVPEETGTSSVSLPTVDNLVILSAVFHVPIDHILATDE